MKEKERSLPQADPEPRKTKKSYVKPELKTHGKLKDLTQTKRGKNNDGGGKAATRISGAPG